MKSILDIADVVELRVWASASAITAGALKEELEAALSGEDVGDAETLSQQAMDEFQSRQNILRDAYPFVCDGNKLELAVAQPTSTTYLFCLTLSLLPASQIENHQRSVQFETVVMNAARQFFGGDALRIGAPWRTESVPDYATLLGKIIDLVPNLGGLSKAGAPGGGDAGWDVLVVKNFCDDSYPRLIALGNCATGRTDWKRKGMESQPGLLWSYFVHEHRSVLLTFFAVPFAMDEDARLRKVSSSNLTMDRFRICEHAPIAGPEVDSWLDSTRSSALDVEII